MWRTTSLLAILLVFTSGQALGDQEAASRFCDAEWGTSKPLVQSCIEAQEAAAGQVDALLSEAATLGWRQEVERQCELTRKTNYVAAWHCAAAAMSARKLEQRDRELAAADAWQKPEGVPEQVFLQVKAQCVREFGLRYGTVEICIDHSTREFRQ